MACRELGQIGDQRSSLARSSSSPSRIWTKSVLSVTSGARRPQVNDTPGGRALLAVGVDMRHHIVPYLALTRLCDLVIHLILMGAQLLELRLGDGQPQLLLGLGQSNPETAPGAEFFLRGEVIQHLPAGVARTQRIFVGLIVGMGCSIVMGGCEAGRSRSTFMSYPALR